jgi:uncharacterized cofD-like protein
MSDQLPKVVTIGGGTGTFTVLSGLKRIGNLDISAIISVTDNGGSTGRLRDEFGYLPVGDFRQALVALAEEGEERNLLRELFMFRFDRGHGLSGHNFGNLFLIAMSELLGTEEEAIAYASSVLRVKGQVIPVSQDRVTLLAEYENGHVVRGETFIDEPVAGHDGTQHIKQLWVEPRAEISERARQSILEADLIVLGPGDLYTSTLADVVVSGVPEALQASKGKMVYVTNLMSRYGQTHGFSTSELVAEVSRYVGREPDFVLVNSTPLPTAVLGRYADHKEFPISDTLGERPGVFRTDLLASEVIEKSDGDVLRRSLIRHDPDKVAQALHTLLMPGVQVVHEPLKEQAS